MLDPLPIGSLLFVGRATARKLNAIGIYTVGQLAAADPQVLRGVLGKAGLTLSGFARGADDASLFFKYYQPVKSVGNSTTPSGCDHERGARLTLLDLSESVAFRLRQQGMAGNGCGGSRQRPADGHAHRYPPATPHRPTDCSYKHRRRHGPYGTGVCVCRFARWEYARARCTPLTRTSSFPLLLRRRRMNGTWPWTAWWTKSAAVRP